MQKEWLLVLFVLHDLHEQDCRREKENIYCPKRRGKRVRIDSCPPSEATRTRKRKEEEEAGTQIFGIVIIDRLSLLSCCSFFPCLCNFTCCTSFLSTHTQTLTVREEEKEEKCCSCVFAEGTHINMQRPLEEGEEEVGRGT
jgi:hypothetical protein